jgi:hypothetical protein
MQLHRALSRRFCFDYSCLRSRSTTAVPALTSPMVRSSSFAASFVSSRSVPQQNCSPLPEQKRAGALPLQTRKPAATDALNYEESMPRIPKYPENPNDDRYSTPARSSGDELPHGQRKRGPQQLRPESRQRKFSASRPGSCDASTILASCPYMRSETASSSGTTTWQNFERINEV